MMTNEHTCPNCGTSTMKGWKDLNDEEKEVVKRLPAASQEDDEERQQMNRWCTRCWYESRARENQA